MVLSSSSSVCITYIVPHSTLAYKLFWIQLRHGYVGPAKLFRSWMTFVMKICRKQGPESPAPLHNLPLMPAIRELMGCGMSRANT
ncbi:hypothetical protein RSOLAG1IB_00671 [Rhizoctonia solani AG-1 IB]|uniref:Uncharacterized protein n=1 Tax=Thanatephorus cucumeris (strain AG1-IB / isolate 7/3/14) TaxID=1108050 RepID=A0A0B7F7G8_THACB|nr:hypothetical protein RSOLAG1IB_00671 [Rhizoctonia solani AG-1 IB]